MTSPGSLTTAQISGSGDWLGVHDVTGRGGPRLVRAQGGSGFVSKKEKGRSAAGGETEDPAERPAPPAAPRPATSRARPRRAELPGCPREGGRGGGPGRSRARRCAAPGHRPPCYTQHVNRGRREEPRERREPAPPGRAACPGACGAARCPPGRRAPEGGGRAGGGGSARRAAREAAAGAAGAAGQDGFPAAG